MALLSGARNQRNSSMSEKIYNRIQQFFPNYKEELVSAAILLANTYQSSGQFRKGHGCEEEAESIRSKETTRSFMDRSKWKDSCK